MSKKRHGAEQIVPKLRQAEVELAQGKTILQICKKLGITEQTQYRWRKKYEGLRTDQAKRLEELERENARLTKLLAEAELDKAMPGPTTSSSPRLTSWPSSSPMGSFGVR